MKTKTCFSERYYCLIAAACRAWMATITAMFVFASLGGSNAQAAVANSYSLMEYFSPMVVGNEWTFEGTDYDGYPCVRVARVESVDWPLIFCTPTRSVTNLVGRMYNNYSDPGTMYPYDEWYEYYNPEDRFGYWGMDDDPGQFEMRFDGFLFPTNMTVGQTVSISKSTYVNCASVGQSTLSVTLVGRTNVTVPAGTFPDCLRVRVALTQSGQSEVFEEWWARGVGTIKHREVPDIGENRRDLTGFSVVTRPHIVTPPQSRTNTITGVATLAVVATGSEPLTYQWRKNGTNLVDDGRITGSASNLLSITDVQYGDAGNYTVVIANDYGCLTSAPPALLTVNETLPPNLLITSHSDLQILTATAITLAGTASDAGNGDNGIASVTVNGVRATNDTAAGSNPANWIRAVTLVAGTNKLVVVARDGRGNLTTNIIRIISDTMRPKLTITAPMVNQRWSNSVFTARGTATDNSSVAVVYYQLNGNGWTAATGTANWTATLDLLVGTNTLRAYSVDNIGNCSPTNTVKFIYVLSAPLTVQINGKGTLNPKYNGALLEIGRNYSMTVTPATGFAFTNWTDGESHVLTNKPAISFRMRSNLVLVANFVDVQKPTLVIKAPVLNQRWSNSVFTSQGTASDNGSLAAVNWQLNGEDWELATGATNWTATLDLRVGTNTLRACAVDSAGNRSITNSVKFIYVLSAPLTVQINGKGTVSPAYNGALLEIDRNYTLTATPGTGCVFTNWTDGEAHLLTNKAALSFRMRSNLVLVANFVDAQKPVLTISYPTAGLRVLTNSGLVTVRGTAKDNQGVTDVLYKLNDDDWTNAATANSWSNWNTTVQMRVGTNVVQAFARDAAGRCSPTNSVSFQYVVTSPLSLEIVGKGTVTGATDGQALEVGRSYTLRASPATGFAFSDWSGDLTGNASSITFMMCSNLQATATFADVQRPTITVSTPLNGARLTNGLISFAGTANDNGQIAAVMCRLNTNDWISAWGTTQWAWDVPLVSGTNILSVYALDSSGNCSPTNKVVVTHFKDLLLTYWPMHDGDWKQYDGPIPYSFITFYGSYPYFTMELDSDGDIIDSQYEYANSDRELWLSGEGDGWTDLHFDPPFVELDEVMLMNNGTRKSSTIISVADQSFAASLTMKVSSAGTITVPTGTYNNCKRSDVTIVVTIPGEGTRTFSTTSYFLAPRVGMVRVGVYQSSGTAFSFVGWEDLVAGSVNGVDVSNLTGPAATMVQNDLLASDLSVAETAAEGDSIRVAEKSTGSIERVQNDQGQTVLVLKGTKDACYMIEAADEEQTQTRWEPFWVGTLPDGVAVIPVAPGKAKQQYRVTDR